MCHDNNKLAFQIPLLQSKKIDLHNLSLKSPQQCKKLHNHNQLKHQHNNIPSFHSRNTKVNQN
jgi:hypothetical protein